MQVLLQAVQQYLSTKPFDLHALHLFHLVVKHRSFTRAAREAGLSPSALTRQMQSLEQRLGLSLIQRTTRSVEVTEAGKFLATEAARLIGSVTSALDGLHANFGSAKPEVRVSVSRTLAMAHMPGLFHANHQRHPEVVCRVSYHPSSTILTALDANETDIGVLCPPSPLPDTVRVTHRFKDRFELIAPAELAGKAPLKRQDRLKVWLQAQPWLMLDATTNTGKALRRWMSRQHLSVQPAMELDSFDLIINLVASGFGLALVPRRALALYRRKESIVILPMAAHFEREVVALTRKHRKLPLHVERFVENILF
ncbi:LysR family transcriptional regulator [Brevifollis gellanilyticus]|uniref:LysR family transcriptional regulator n=1 Tax=Brevifollis gellanilyticus TaxID=748831 RepID=A0A512M4M8_9BACT|nr:LysR family transcriptional regulator [Brevifollis gellanilyticus]